MVDQTIVFRLLDHRGVKLQRFADLIGFSYAYVYSIMVGKRPITEEFRRRCVSYFQVPEDVLFLASAQTDACEADTGVSLSGDPGEATAAIEDEEGLPTP